MQIPVLQSEFVKMARYGKAQQQAALVIGKGSRLMPLHVVVVDRRVGFPLGGAGSAGRAGEGVRRRGGAPPAGLGAGHQSVPRPELPQPRLLLLAAGRGARPEGHPVGRGHARPALEAAAAHRPAGGQRAGRPHLSGAAGRAAAVHRRRSSSASPTIPAWRSRRGASSSCSAARCWRSSSSTRAAGRSSRSSRSRSARCGPSSGRSFVDGARPLHPRGLAQAEDGGAGAVVDRHPARPEGEAAAVERQGAGDVSCAPARSSAATSS